MNTAQTLLCRVHPCRAALSHQMAGGAGCCRVCVCVWGVLSTSEAEALTGPEHRGEAAGGPCPQMVFHLLCFHTEPPSSRLWESALRASSDPSGSAFVAAHPSLSSSSRPFSVLFLFFPSFSLLVVPSVLSVLYYSCFLLLVVHTEKIITTLLLAIPSVFLSYHSKTVQLQRCN